MTPQHQKIVSVIASENLPLTKRQRAKLCRLSMSAFGRHLRELEAMRLITRELVEINGSKLIQIKITRTALKGAA